MKKLSSILVILVLMMAILPFSAAQDEAEAIPEVVVDRIEEYGELIPEMEAYNTLKVEDLSAILAEDDIEVTFLDVREVEEVEEVGIIEGAVHIPLRELAENLNKLPDQEAFIVVVCKAGFRATIAMTTLHILGYENAHVLVGGFDGWVAEEMPVVTEVTETEVGEAPEIDEELVAYVSDYLANLPEGWGGVKSDMLFEEMFETAPDYLIDVRSDAEWADPGFIEGAEHVWINEFVARMEEWPAEKDANIVVYCSGGYRGGIAATLLGLMGYTNVRNLSGGLNGWVALDLPLVTPES